MLDRAFDATGISVPLIKDWAAYTSILIRVVEHGESIKVREEAKRGLIDIAKKLETYYTLKDAMEDAVNNGHTS